MIKTHNIVTFDIGVNTRLCNSTSLEKVDGDEGDNEKANDNCYYFDCRFGVMNVIVVTIFPNDVSWLSRFNEIERLIKELGYRIFLLMLKRVSYNLSIFFLKSNESINWFDEL